MHPRIQEVLGYLAEQRAALSTALESVPPALRERRPAPDQWSVAEAWSALERSRDHLLATVAVLDGLAIGAVRAPHPVLGELDGYQWLAFIGAHEGRHAQQIREVGLALSLEMEA